MFFLVDIRQSNHFNAKAQTGSTACETLSLRRTFNHTRMRVCVFGVIDGPDKTDTLT